MQLAPIMFFLIFIHFYTDDERDPYRMLHAMIWNKRDDLRGRLIYNVTLQPKEAEWLEKTSPITQMARLRLFNLLSGASRSSAYNDAGILLRCPGPPTPSNADVPLPATITVLDLRSLGTLPGFRIGDLVVLVREEWKDMSLKLQDATLGRALVGGQPGIGAHPILRLCSAP
jgi:hypothetical protein